MKRLLQYFKGYQKESILGPVFKLCEALLELTVPMIVARVIDEAIPSGETSQVLRYIFLMIVVGLVGFILAITAQYYSAKAAVGFTRQLNNDLFKKIMALPQAEVDKNSPASLVNRMTSDTFQMQTGVNIFFRLFLRSPFIVIGSLVMAMQIESRVALIFTTMIILLFVVVGGILKLTSPMFTNVRKRLDHLVQLTRQQVKGMRVIRAFRQEAREIEEFKSTNQHLNHEQLKAANGSVLTNPLTYVIVNICLVLIIWQGSQWVNVGSLTQGGLVALVNYLLQILVELIKLTMVISTMNKAMTSAKRVVEVFNLEDEATTFEQNAVTNPQSLYEFNQVQFYYPNTQAPALEQLNFTINKGDFFGIIGSTGSGKSTLIELLTKNYDPTVGQISVNSQLLKTDTRSELRESIALVPQLATLFKGTVRSNLLLANPDASEEAMWQALKVAQADGFIKEKYGLDTKVEAFGRNFSGGQRQRLTLARALVKEAEIYIFDDSTSALDYLTEANFQKAVQEHFADKTIIMISQRTHSVLKANQILVLNEGKQIGLGTHAQLLVECPIYREIDQSQKVAEVKEDE